MGQIKVAAVVLQYGQWEKTAACVESLLQSTMRPAWVIVVDNASPDDSARRMEELLRSRVGQDLAVFTDITQTEYSPLILLRLKHNGGYAAGNNAGIRIALAAGADAVLIINNDAEVAGEAIASMAQTLFNAPRPGLCGAMIVYPKAGEPIQCLAGGHTNYLTGISSFIGEKLTARSAQKIAAAKVESELNFICGACVMASSSFLHDIGLMDEGYFLYCEEEDWALRAKGKYTLSYAANARCYHHEGATTGFGRHSFSWKPGLRIFLSRLRLAWIHHPYYIPTVILGCCYAGARLVRKQIVNLLKNALSDKTHKK